MARSPKRNGVPRPDVTVPLCAADKLCKPSVHRKRSNVDYWLETHPAALDFVDTWLRMLKDGSSDWSVPEVEAELRAEHGWEFPHRALRWWLESHRGYGRRR